MDTSLFEKIFRFSCFTSLPAYVDIIQTISLSKKVTRLTFTLPPFFFICFFINQLYHERKCCWINYQKITCSIFCLGYYQLIITLLVIERCRGFGGSGFILWLWQLPNTSKFYLCVFSWVMLLSMASNFVVIGSSAVWNSYLETSSSCSLVRASFE